MKPHLRWRGPLLMVLATLASPLTGAPATAPSPPSLAAFRTFLDGLWPEAESRGIPRPLFDATFGALQPDPAVAALTRKQPEEAKPLGAYLASSVTAGRAAAGRALLARWADVLEGVEERYGVPGPVVIAVWGLETNYGASPGAKDVIRSTATLAAMNYRPDLYRDELLSAVSLLAKGAATRDQLKGSWAGAMGQPQFMPSSFEKFAADGDGDGRRDIWADVPDALASIANFLKIKGWQAGKPWGYEVRLPQGFDYAKSRGSAADWAALGVTRPDGSAPTGEGELVMFFPAGAQGAAFLVTPNYEVIKTYNFSDAYVLSVGLLGDAIGRKAEKTAGGPGVEATWPGDPPISRDSRIALQTQLVRLGYDVDNREGRISLRLRDAIRSAQKSVGRTPDGNPTQALLEALRAR